ncbi:MAG: hypothetical protein NZ898_14750, partial [Myxococcota bacterium]|nr:hypothetical protein [Myxococcota bacterium]
MTRPTVSSSSDCPGWGWGTLQTIAVDPPSNLRFGVYYSDWGTCTTTVSFAGATLSSSSDCPGWGWGNVQ